jgi:hypothetical protein
MTMSRVDRATPAAVIVAIGLSLSACSSSTFDPTDWISGEWFEKPKLAGERKPVFPGGVPGVPEGVPAELLKGNQQAAVETPPVVAAEPAPSAKPAKPARPQASKPPPKPRTASAPPQPASPRPEPAAAQRPPANQGAAPAWPEPGTQANWPPPDPSTFSR